MALGCLCTGARMIIATGRPFVAARHDDAPLWRAMLCSSLGRRGAGGLGVGACARCAQVVSPRPKSFLLWSKPRDCPCSYCMCARARDLGFAFCCAAATAEASCNQGSQAACASVRHAEMVRRVTRLCLVSHRHFAYVYIYNIYIYHRAVKNVPTEYYFTQIPDASASCDGRIEVHYF